MGLSAVDVATAFDVRRAAARGKLSTSWLDARFSFSFGAWQQPGRERFGPLRALNEDVVQPASGFGMHPHSDMDIFMLPLSGAIEHRDSLGNHTGVRPGEVLRMKAGRGIRHSQMNPSPTAPDHHLQVWIEPQGHGGEPSAERRSFDLFSTERPWCSIVSPDGTQGSFVPDRPAWLSSALVQAGAQVHHQPRAGSLVYLHVIDGELGCADGTRRAVVASGDAVAIADAGLAPIRLKGIAPASRVLLFEFDRAKVPGEP